MNFNCMIAVLKTPKLEHLCIEPLKRMWGQFWLLLSKQMFFFFNKVQNLRLYHAANVVKYQNYNLKWNKFGDLELQVGSCKHFENQCPHWLEEYELILGVRII